MSTAEPTLSPQERAAIIELTTHYPVPRAACIDALKYVQHRRRYIADDILPEIAGLLSMSAAELDEVATFYNLIFRQPVGETVILLCDSITCWMLGRDKIAAKIQTTLGIKPGETTKDGKYTFLPVVCLGHCDHAPAMLLGGKLIGDLEPAQISDLFGLVAA
jgi:NADH-quinone oxidoreductase subunit E